MPKAKPITVVSVTRTVTGGFVVRFSEPVFLNKVSHKSRHWMAERPDGWVASTSEMDELGAYIWGCKLIERQGEWLNSK